MIPGFWALGGNVIIFKQMPMKARLSLQPTSEAGIVIYLTDNGTPRCQVPRGDKGQWEFRAERKDFHSGSSLKGVVASEHQKEGGAGLRQSENRGSQQ